MRRRGTIKCFDCHSGTIIEPSSYEGPYNYGECDECGATFPHPQDRCSECGGHYKDCECEREWEEELEAMDYEEMLDKAKPGTCPECSSTNIEDVRVVEDVDNGVTGTEILCECGFYWVLWGDHKEEDDEAAASTTSKERA